MINSFIFRKVTTPFNRERRVSEANNAGWSYTKELNWILTSHHIQRSTQVDQRPIKAKLQTY